MNPKEKAKELTDNYFSWYGDEYYFPYKFAKECALIAVEEMLANIDATIFYHKESIALPFNKKYWQEVKQEIELL